MLHNQILSNKKTKKKLLWILISFGLFAFFCIVSLFGYYKYIFRDFKIDSNVEHFGQFGDFIGGTLNPILAFLSFMALLYTIKIQTDELKLSREELEATRSELKESRIAQQEQSNSLKLQNEATKLQMFENTFFKLVDLFINIGENLILEVTKNEYYEKIGLDSSIHYICNDIEETTFREIKYKLYKGNNEVFNVYLLILKNYEVYENFNNKYEKNTGVYFGQIYQILKFINDSNIENKQRYVNIFRAQFTKNELEFLFYHCLGTIGKKRFKKLVEDYEFFEHIILNEYIKKQLLEYDKKAFGNNEKISKIYAELKAEKESYKYIELKSK